MLSVIWKYTYKNEEMLVFHEWARSEWVIKFNGLSGDSEQWGPYKPCNHNLYIGIIIFPHIDNPQSTGHNLL